MRRFQGIVFYHLKLDKELAPIFGLSSNTETSSHHRNLMVIQIQICLIILLNKRKKKEASDDLEI